MKEMRFIFFITLVLAASSCSLKWLTKSKQLRSSDRVFVDDVKCTSNSMADTFCLTTVGNEDIRRLLAEKKRKLNVMYFVHSGCKGFHKVFLGYKSAFDSIEDLSLHIVFGEDFRQIPILKSTLLQHKFYGAHLLMDEAEYGRYNDPRTKNKRALEQLTPSNSKMMISPFTRIPENGPYTPGYGFLTATMYLLYDENLNFLCASWDLSPNDVKRILNGEKPLQ